MLDGGAANPPHIASHVFGYFVEMAGMRESGEHGPRHLTPKDMAAWCTLREVKLEQWEVNAVILMDRAFIEHWHANKDKPKVSNRPLSAALVREMMQQ
jgi:hypothetical protein